MKLGLLIKSNILLMNKFYPGTYVPQKNDPYIDEDSVNSSLPLFYKQINKVVS